MANINQTLKAREAAKAAEEAANKLTAWQESAEKALAAEKPVRATVPTVAGSIASTGYPKNLRFGYACVTVMDEHDHANFWKCVYSNLSKAELAEIAKPEHKPLTETQVCQALQRSAQRIQVAQDLVENGIHEGAVEFENDGRYYVLASKMVIGLDGQVICDVSDLNEPFGPEEWVEIANRIKAPQHNGYDATEEDAETEREQYVLKVTELSGAEFEEYYDSEEEAREAYEGYAGAVQDVELYHELIVDDECVDHDLIEEYHKEDGEM